MTPHISFYSIGLDIGLAISHGLPDITHINPYSAGTDFSRQILTIKVDPRTVIVNIFIMAVDP